MGASNTPTTTIHLPIYTFHTVWTTINNSFHWKDWIELFSIQTYLLKLYERTTLIFLQLIVIPFSYNCWDASTKNPGNAGEFQEEWSLGLMIYEEIESGCRIETHILVTVYMYRQGLDSHIKLPWNTTVRFLQLCPTFMFYVLQYKSI